MKSRTLCNFLRVIAGLLLAGPLFLFAQEQGNPLEARHAPDWLRSGLIYEVFPRSFSQAGNLSGITADLDRLKASGVTIIWLMPIHPVGKIGRLGSEGSPYAVQDYYAISPEYGTKDDLRRLVKEAHRRGMKVIMDMVADHTALDSVMRSRPDFYQRDAKGALVSPHGWNDVAALDYSNPALRQYMINALIYWVKEFSIDGYRCDAAGMVPTDFWEQARVALERANPNVLMLAEASKPDLMRTAFDIDYAWPLLFKLDGVIERGAPASDLRELIQQQQALFPKHSIHMLISDDHDEQRALVRYGAQGALAASALMFTLDGVPLLYNGMEVGDTTPSSGPALFESLRIYWPAAELWPECAKFYAFMIPFRKGHPALWRGDTQWLDNSDEQHVVSYERSAEGDHILVVVNLSNVPFRGTVESGKNKWQEVAVPSADQKPDTLPVLYIEPFGFRIFESMSAF